MTQIAKIALVAVLAATTAMAPAAFAATSKSAQDFVKKASVANKFEIDSSKLALAKSQNADVKDFANSMIQDHEKAGAELKSTLPKSSVSPEAVENKLDAKHQAVLDKLKNASGTNFDKQYIAAQKDAHKEAVSLFSGYASKGDDAAIKEFAGKTLPTLKKHKEHVDELKAM